MKLILKADDYGYTKAYNDGTIKAIEDGLVTTVDLMLDTPGVADAIERIKNYPWISIGWHSDHYWGAPAADPALIPSMVNAEGKFRFRHDKKAKKEVPYEEARIEIEAELQRCIRLLGRVPETTRIHDFTPLNDAKRDLCDKYGIAYGYIHQTRNNMTVLPKYEALNLVQMGSEMSHKNEMGYLYYDGPVKFFTETLPEKIDITSDIIVLSAWHPGFLDDYIVNESSCCTMRPRDCLELCSERLKQWVIDNQIELISLKDAVYGTNDYQNHLAAINSPLAIRR